MDSIQQSQYPLLEDSKFRHALKVLEQGGIVAFPTETYYGLAVDPYNSQALLSLFQLKQRQLSQAVLVLITDLRQLSQLTATVPVEYEQLMRSFWPGPLTFIFDALAGISPYLTGNSGTVGVRISSHPVAKQLGMLWKRPITATSANISGFPPAESSSDVKKIFGNGVDCILDGGRTKGGKPSTIVSLRQKKIVVLREGQVDLRISKTSFSAK